MCEVIDRTLSMISLAVAVHLIGTQIHRTMRSPPDHFPRDDTVPYLNLVHQDALVGVK